MHYITRIVLAVCVYAISPSLFFADAAELADSVSQVPQTTVTDRHQRTPVELDKKHSDKKKKKKAQDDADATSVKVVDLSGDTIEIAAIDSIPELLTAEIIAARQDSIKKDSIMLATYGKERVFNPNPTRAVWLSALFPGLGQIYNRRYWKLPIIVGGYVGLAYATSWNNGMLRDYTKAYNDAMDNDPNTNSYMNFYPSTTREEDIDMSWLQSVLKSKKDYYRRNRDLCIIGMVGLYLVCIIDAYVDASLAHFDITPDLSMQVKPAVIEPHVGRLPSVGLQCAFSF